MGSHQIIAKKNRTDVSVPESMGIMVAVFIVNVTEDGDWIMKSVTLQMAALSKNG